MEIDPEVRALLDDLPPTKLPEALVEQGWGRHTMANSFGGTRKRPATDVTPTFEPCVQCGRPVALHRGRRRDHAGRIECDAAIVGEDGRLDGQHLIQEEVEYARLMRQMRQEYPVVAEPLPARAKLPPIPAGPCASNKGTRACHHVCDHPSGHFGFHECKTCRHLWR